MNITIQGRYVNVMSSENFPTLVGPEHPDQIELLDVPGDTIVSLIDTALPHTDPTRTITLPMAELAALIRSRQETTPHEGE